MKQGRTLNEVKNFLVRSVVLLMMGSGITGCELMGFPEWEWRQKVTVEVETPSGLVSASSVMAVKCGSSPKWAPGAGAGGMGCQVRGEAVPVEIAPGRVLFALLKAAPGSTNYPAKIAYHVFFPNRKLTTVEERGNQLERGIQGVQTLPKKNYPLLVTFDDLSKPKTVQKVDPENLAGMFGRGVSLKRLTLEITDEPVTEGKIEKYGFMNVLKVQSTLSGLEKFDKNYDDPIYYLTNKAFKLGDKK